RAQVKIDAARAPVYEAEIDYPQRIGWFEQAITVPVGTSYRVRAIALKGDGKLQHILASGMMQGVIVENGSQPLTLTLAAPLAELSVSASPGPGSTLLFRYRDSAALLDVGEHAVLWCNQKNAHINTGGQQVLAAIERDPVDSFVRASFTIPASDAFTYCQAGY